MEELIWAKTILGVYNSIEKYILKLDTTISNLSLMPQLNVDIVTTKIIDLSDRKISLINLKLIIEKLIASCKAKHLRILSLRHIQGLTMEEIALVMNITERTCYRLYADALKNFVVNMQNFGYSSSWFYEYLKMEKWILHQFAREYARGDNLKITSSANYNSIKGHKEFNFNSIYANQLRKSLF